MVNLDAWRVLPLPYLQHIGHRWWRVFLRGSRALSYWSRVSRLQSRSGGSFDLGTHPAGVYLAASVGKIADTAFGACYFGVAYRVDVHLVCRWLLSFFLHYSKCFN